MRILTYGPDGRSNWDQLPYIGLYLSHAKNSLAPTSHAGATMHAYGVKADLDAFGFPPGSGVARSGLPKTILQEAMDAGLPTGIINSGAIYEPGTAVFAASDASRSHRQEISAKVVRSGIDLIFSGGEIWLLPKGMRGHHGDGIRDDGVDLIAWAKQAGYHVVYEVGDLDSVPPETDKILGVFAAKDTFNDDTEEDLKAAGLPLYEPSAPTVAQMTRFALDFLGKKGDRFFLVVEEEGTDNFGNYNNAVGMLEALHRADDAVAVVQDYLKGHPTTLLVTASDSEAGGMELIGFPTDRMDPEHPLDATADNGAPIDGRGGAQTRPFLAAPDRFGQRLPFCLAWSTRMDTYGSVVVRCDGLNAERLTGTIDNTEIYRVMYLTLFGRWLD